MRLDRALLYLPGETDPKWRKNMVLKTSLKFGVLMGLSFHLATATSR